MKGSRYLCIGALAGILVLAISNTSCGGGASTHATVVERATSGSPTVTLTANPLTIDAGQVSTLSWSSTNASTLTISPRIPGDDGAALPPSGVGTVGPIATAIYTATATGPGGTATASVTITVNSAKPKVTFTANPAPILPGQTTTLTWTTQLATSISIDQGSGPVEVPSGSRNVRPAQTTTYIATA